MLFYNFNLDKITDVQISSQSPNFKPQNTVPAMFFSQQENYQYIYWTSLKIYEEEKHYIDKNFLLHLLFLCLDLRPWACTFYDLKIYERGG